VQFGSAPARKGCGACDGPSEADFAVRARRSRDSTLPSRICPSYCLIRLCGSRWHLDEIQRFAVSSLGDRTHIALTMFGKRSGNELSHDEPVSSFHQQVRAPPRRARGLEGVFSAPMALLLARLGQRLCTKPGFTCCRRLLLSERQLHEGQHGSQQPHSVDRNLLLHMGTDERRWHDGRGFAVPDSAICWRLRLFVPCEQRSLPVLGLPSGQLAASLLPRWACQPKVTELPILRALSRRPKLLRPDLERTD